MSGLPFTLRQLEIFELLCELRSFRQASEELGISQASVSNQLKALEDQMGVRLLTRDSGRRAQLTTEGAAFLADLGEFWRTANALAAHRHSEPAEPPGHVRLKVLIGNYLLKDCVRPKLDRFHEAHPHIHLDFISPTISDLPREMAARDNFDLAMFQDQFDRPQLEGTRELGRIRCGVFGHRSMTEGRNDLLTAEEVSSLPFLLPPVNSPYENLVLGLLARESIKPSEIVGRTQYFDVMSAMFERGNSVGVSVEPIIKKEHRNVVMLYRLEDWGLFFYRDPRKHGAELQATEDFLIWAVVEDADYPLIRTVDAGTAGD